MVIKEHTHASMSGENKQLALIEIFQIIILKIFKILEEADPK
jgi:hypothetical protein